MFDIIPNFLSSVFGVLLPVFASYKALRASDPAQLAPWLMYWVVYALFSLADFYAYPILSLLVPFFAYMRLGVLLYLVLPQTQGARRTYEDYVHPFLAERETAIENALADILARARSTVSDGVYNLVAWLRQTILQQQAPPPPPPPPPKESYVSSLLARFTLPTGRSGVSAAASPAGDLYGLISSAAAALGNGGSGSAGRQLGSAFNADTRDAQIEALGQSGALIPDAIRNQGRVAQARYVASQRDRLRVLLGALDREAGDLMTGEPAQAAGSSEMKKSKSEASFERIDDRDVADEDAEDASRQRKPAMGSRAASGSGWMPWSSWKGAESGEQELRPGTNTQSATTRGKSSGINVQM